MDWPALLGRLVGQSSLSREEAESALGEILVGSVAEAHVAAFLTALSAKGETVEEMTGFVDAMMAAATTISVPEGTIDVVGTGGDQLHTVNLSTMAALTVAACGVPVAKHGNRAASSRVGTADVLEAAGVRLDAEPAVVSRCVAEAGMGFCFAQLFHPGLRYLGPIRRQLGFPTVFNVLGPLANPARVRRQLVGVASDARVDAMAGVLFARGIERAILVHGDDGLDELSLGTTSRLVEVTSEGISSSRLDPLEAFGVRHDVAELVGGDVAENLGALQDFLAGTRGAIFDTVTANAALALYVAGRATNLGEGMELARAAVLDGRAAHVLARLVEISNS